jgi:hypothetical protein
VEVTPSGNGDCTTGEVKNLFVNAGTILCRSVKTYFSLSNLFHFLPDSLAENQTENWWLHICWNRENEASVLFAWMRLKKHIAKVTRVRMRVNSHPASIGSVSDDHFIDIKWNGATIFGKR